MPLSDNQLLYVADRLASLGHLFKTEELREIMDTIAIATDELHKPETKFKMVCRRCGSNRVLRDAWAEWSIEHQVWELQNVFDHAVCESRTCDGNETSIDMVEITQGEDDAGTAENQGTDQASSSREEVDHETGPSSFGPHAHLGFRNGD